jgi:hypothetical protein
MQDSMNTQQVPTVVFDDGGDSIFCHGSTLADLIKSAASVNEIQVGTLAGRITMPMWTFIRSLEAIREFAGGDDFPFLCCAASDAYDELRSNSRLRVLSGLSPDESALFLVFASPGRRASIAQAKTGNQERPKTEA